MKSTPVLVSALVVAAGLASAIVAGPLSPPAGSVAPTFKTLAEVEPRTLVGPSTTPGDANSVFRISQPGSYYLTGDVVGAAGKNGIEIAAGNVTLDLNAYTLRGAPGSLSGVTLDVDSPKSNVVIRNGNVSDWARHGVELKTDAFGSVLTGRVENLNITSNGLDGVVAAFGVIVQDCTARGNRHGFVVRDGCIVDSCTALANNGNGIDVPNAATVRRSTASNNLQNGIVARLGSTVSECTATDNGLDGIVGSNTCTIEDCMVELNDRNGIEASASIVRRCTSHGNSQLGIRVVASSLIEDNVVQFNGFQFDGAAILATSSNNIIRNNRMSESERGLKVNFTNNVITGNVVAIPRGAHYEIAAGNKVGPIISMPDSPAIVGSSGGSGIGTANPFANFSH